MAEWLNVNDNIPEIGQQAAPYNWSAPVLCFLKDKTVHIACLTDTGFWRNFEGKYHFPYENVTHWMPLPLPPKSSST